MSGFVQVEVADKVAWLTLSEPERLNPVDVGRIAEITAACAEIGPRPDVAVVVVTGAGRGFCSGADLSQGLSFGPDHPPASGSWSQAGPLVWPLAALPQPVIAMVNGPAAGFGAELALQADIRWAGESARFVFPFTRIGLVSDTGAASWMLPRLIGVSAALEVLLFADPVPADEALRLGIVSAVWPDAELRARTAARAAELATRPRAALARMKGLVLRGLDQRRGEHVFDQYVEFSRATAEADPQDYLRRVRGT